MIAMTEIDQTAIESYNAGLAHARAGRLADARACYEHAIAIRPSYVRAHHNLATLLDDLGEHVKAEAHFRAAIAADPNAAEPWAGLGGNQRLRGRLGAARQAYEHALDLRVEFPAARWNLALIDLAEGKFTDGWTNYLFRPSVDRSAAPLVELPQDLQGKTVEIVDEQGLGDSLFFLRFVPQLRERGAGVRYEPDTRIAEMVVRSADFGTAPSGDPAYRVALGDLPFLLKSKTCPPSMSLAPLGERVEAMRAALSEVGPAPYVAVTWRAGQRADGYLFKDVPIADFAACFPSGNGTLISVQRAPKVGERERFSEIFGSPLADFSAYNDDLEDMLALMSLLDDYAGVSNTNMHLRAAIGKRARVLVPNPAEYRWMANGEESPWFPGFKTYRQAADGDWRTALSRLAGDLRA